MGGRFSSQDKCLPCCSVATNPGTPCSVPVETDSAKPQGWLWEICCSVLFAPNSQVGLPAEISGSLDSLRAPRERLSGTAACHLLWAGGGEQGTLAGLGAAFRHSILQEQQDQASCLTRIGIFFLLQQRKTCVCGPALLCCPTVGTWFGGAEWIWGVGGILVPPSPAQSSSSLTVGTALLPQKSPRGLGWHQAFGERRGERCGAVVTGDVWGVRSCSYRCLV